MTSQRLIESHRIYAENLARHVPPGLKKRKKLGTHISIVDLVNLHSESEKQGGGRPEYWEMVFWWTRKPLAGARFVVAASLLPENVDLARLARALGLLSERVAHRENPRIELLGEHEETLKNASLLDPFAGFGSIPLEALRLGLKRVVAVELLPVAYVFLKAVLEYPAKYGHLKEKVSPEEARSLKEYLDLEKLARKGLARPLQDGYEAPALLVDLARAAKWLTEQLANDPDIKELYDPDVAIYIGTWEVKCPWNNKYTPLVGNWWLARVKDNTGKGYKRLAYMKPVNRNGEIEIEVVDLNKTLKTKTITGAKIEGGNTRITINGKTYQVPEPNIKPRSETAICLHDSKPLGYIDPETGKHYTSKQQAPPKIRERLEWLPKWAIKQWNKMIEEYLQGKITLEELRQAPARPRILVKVKTTRDGDIEFHPATREDNEKLWKATEKLRQYWNDPDLPKEPIPPYETRRLLYHYGFDKWYKLFNPRQTLIIIKIIKNIRNIRDYTYILSSYNNENDYLNIILLYLSISLARLANYNNIMTRVDPSNPWGIKIAEALSLRGIAMQWNFGDTNILSLSNVHTNILQTQGSFIKNIIKIIDSVTYLLTINHTSNNDAYVLLNDATMLPLNCNRFDVVVTDPPFYDDVPYSELSDFYYVWLKRALSGVEGGRLVPRFLPEAFFRRVGGGWREVRTQWEEFARREVSVNPGRLGGASREAAERWFEERLGAALRRASGLLVEGGRLVTYYNHTSKRAWASLLRAGWEIAGLQVTGAVPLVTESGQRVTGRGKVRLDTSIVVVWRKRVADGGVCVEEGVRRAAVAAARSAVEALLDSGRVGLDMLFAALARALAVATQCGSIVSPSKRLTAGDVADLAYNAAVTAIAEALSGVAGVRVDSGPGRFYLVTRVLFAGEGRIRFDGPSIGLLKLGAGAELDSLLARRVLREARGGGERLYELLYPEGLDRRSLERLLRERGLVASAERAAVRSSIDALHLLYYHALLGELPAAEEALQRRAPELLEEAQGIARILSRLLPDGDPEKVLAGRVAARGGIQAWLK